MLRHIKKIMTNNTNHMDIHQTYNQNKYLTKIHTEI